MALEHHRKARLPTTIASLVEAIDLTAKRIFDTSEYRWAEGDINLAGSRILMPLLLWREGVIDKLRREWWNAAIRPERH